MTEVTGLQKPVAEERQVFKGAFHYGRLLFFNRQSSKIIIYLIPYRHFEIFHSALYSQYPGARLPENQSPGAVHASSVQYRQHI